MKTRVGVLISGRGSNMEALIEASRAPDCPYEIVLVLSNKSDAGGLETARAAGIEARAVDQKDFFRDREGHERALDAALRGAGVEVIALAGYMRVLTPFLVKAWEGRMMNIHPSLLPLFPGLDTHNRVIAAGHAEHGCTVHLVTVGVDEGPVVAQARVPVLPGDDAQSLSERVLVAEHQLYPKALSDFCRKLAAA
ncbi:phosphoribosylglycinamide formyltransferase [Caulobacter sp. NIBR2454]|uniref:phosphoribosylglycinamide formyltransferase n=1 Tax=Caulobacter sp. NIBR2454 TaxID=3015996 RepID=UPI0022B6139F|nr:phosphoribosylglycinamide formyltransferase [Caulobacter sp. NIBR2454]